MFASYRIVAVFSVSHLFLHEFAFFASTFSNCFCLVSSLFPPHQIATHAAPARPGANPLAPGQDCDQGRDFSGSRAARRRGRRSPRRRVSPPRVRVFLWKYLAQIFVCADFLCADFCVCVCFVRWRVFSDVVAVAPHSIPTHLLIDCYPHIIISTPHSQPQPFQNRSHTTNSHRDILFLSKTTHSNTHLSKMPDTCRSIRTSVRTGRRASSSPFSWRRARNS